MNINTNKITIEDKAHFNLFLKQIRHNYKDLLQNIDKLFRFALIRTRKRRNPDAMNMLYDIVGSKLPVAKSAFTDYITTFGGVKVWPNTKYFGVDHGKIVTDNPPDFLDWVDSEKRLYKEGVIKLREDLMRVSQEYLIKRKERLKAEASKTTTGNDGPSCPCCGKKFRPNSKDSIATHTCKSAKKRMKSIWTISGGGGPGTGKRR